MTNTADVSALSSSSVGAGSCAAGASTTCDWAEERVVKQFAGALLDELGCPRGVVQGVSLSSAVVFDPFCGVEPGGAPPRASPLMPLSVDKAETAVDVLASGTERAAATGSPIPKSPAHSVRPCLLAGALEVASERGVLFDIRPWECR